MRRKELSGSYQALSASASTVVSNYGTNIRRLDTQKRAQLCLNAKVLFSVDDSPSAETALAALRACVFHWKQPAQFQVLHEFYGIRKEFAGKVFTIPGNGI
jgi:hypothetical protein